VSGRVSQGALPVSGMPWGLGMRIRIRSRIQGLIYSLRAIYSCTARHAQLRDLGLRLEIKSRSGHARGAVGWELELGAGRGPSELIANRQSRMVAGGASVASTCQCLPKNPVFESRRGRGFGFGFFRLI
jgi:hypothetical protein